jgi:UDP-2,3-diacylglucosamine hydrolase
MMNSSAIIFSDLHLPSEINSDYQLFLNKLQSIEKDQSISEVWLLGDIFDCLVGDQNFWLKVHSQFWSQLEHFAKSGKKVLYFEGNHDFAFKHLALKHGVQVFSEGRCHLFQGRRVFLSHGDEVDIDNEAYARWRKFTKSSKVRRAYNMLPESVPKKLVVPFAEFYSAKRKAKRDPEHFENETEHYRQKFKNYAEKVIRERSYNAVFLGHSHIPELNSLGSTSFYCNLGSWLGEQKPYAIWNPEKENLPVILSAIT